MRRKSLDRTWIVFARPKSHLMFIKGTTLHGELPSSMSSQVRCSRREEFDKRDGSRVTGLANKLVQDNKILGAYTVPKDFIRALITQKQLMCYHIHTL